MGGCASSGQTLAPAVIGDPRVCGVPVPDLPGLSHRNLARLSRGHLDLIAILTSESIGDNQLRAFIFARIADVDTIVER